MTWDNAEESDLGLLQKHSSSEVLERNGGGEVLDTFEKVTLELKEPSIEDQLAFHTLWPESHKLYGHGKFENCWKMLPQRS